MNQRLPLIIFALVMAAIPFIPGVPPFWIVLLNNIGLAALVAMGLVLLTGVGGLTSFGQAAFVGIAAYATAWATTTEGLSPWLGLLLALALTGLAALAIGALAGVAIYMRDPNHRFGLIHLLGFSCVLSAVVSASVSAYPQEALLKSLSLFLLFLYGATGARLAAPLFEPQKFFASFPHTGLSGFGSVVLIKKRVGQSSQDALHTLDGLRWRRTPRNLLRPLPPGVQQVAYTVDDIEAARNDLIARGAKVSEVFQYAGGPFNNTGKNPRVSGRDPQDGSYFSFASFEDPDGNGYLLQQIKTRLPGREWKSAPAGSP